MKINNCQLSFQTTVHYELWGSNQVQKEVNISLVEDLTHASMRFQDGSKMIPICFRQGVGSSSWQMKLDETK